MTCHRDGARHCSCAPEALDAGAPEHGSHLLLASPDPRAHAALRLLAAPLQAEVTTPREGVSSVSGGVTELLLAAAAAAAAPRPEAPGPEAPGPKVLAPEVPSAVAPTWAPTFVTPPEGFRPEPAAELPHRAELLTSLELAMARRRPGAATGLLFCSIGDDEPRGSVLGAVASRIRGQLRRSDELAHLGGGRFVALLADLPLATGEGAAARVVAAVRDSLAEPVSTSSGLFPLGALVGVLVHPSDVEEAAQEEAAGRADVDAPSPTAEHMLAVVERAMERGPLPTP